MYVDEFQATLICNIKHLNNKFFVVHIISSLYRTYVRNPLMLWYTISWGISIVLLNICSWKIWLSCYDYYNSFSRKWNDMETIGRLSGHLFYICLKKVCYLTIQSNSKFFKCPNLRVRIFVHIILNSWLWYSWFKGKLPNGYILFIHDLS